MSFSVITQWNTQASIEGEFNRDHSVTFGSGQTVQASSAPEYKGNQERVNPEEQLLAALSSCHMLTFLTIAHLKRLPVQTYTDNASAILGKNAAGKIAIVKLVLKPEIVFQSGVDVSAEVLEKIHEKAHANCFIANSLSSEIEVIYS
ncbi:OsmC family protein [Shewanella woodyi]|uniref:OsmC family protein n=1 Tax=Shewanella woodyi (strain ATCC 51908 / MS32) TaxID=392500 RepID=B1KNX3_SHEWM|nr:OsmC family protein [Shewanella woodyi]ACA87581.1 OsmC family protein [Shewanella woodyi ATCC 51908]